MINKRKINKVYSFLCEMTPPFSSSSIKSPFRNPIVYIRVTNPRRHFCVVRQITLTIRFRPNNRVSISSSRSIKQPTSSHDKTTHQSPGNPRQKWLKRRILRKILEFPGSSSPLAHRTGSACLHDGLVVLPQHADAQVLCGAHRHLQPHFRTHPHLRVVVLPKVRDLFHW